MQKKRTNLKSSAPRGGAEAKTKSTGSKPRKQKNDLKSTTNDPSWYAVDPIILRDAASFPFSHPAGHPLRTDNTDNGKTAIVPGVMSYTVIPTIGQSTDASSPVNLAATQSYAFIRHGNSGSVNYEAPDIMLYYLAMSDVYSYIEYLKRIYGIAQLYAQRNRFMPYTLLHAMKVDPASVIYNLADFRLGINMLVNKAASFAVPNIMSLFHRRAFLYQNVYTEGDSIKDQLYLLKPGAFSIYNWEESKLDLVQFNPKAVGALFGEENAILDNFNITTLLKFGNYMLDLIIANEDMGTMNGDILKVYGDNIIKLSHIDESYVVVPLKDTLFLEQLQNTTVMPGLIIDSCAITSTYSEESNTEGMPILKSEPHITFIPQNVDGAAAVNVFVSNGKMLHCMHKKVLNTTAAESTPELVMELTRFMTSLADKIVDEDLNEEYSFTSGTEIVNKVEIYKVPATLNDKPEVLEFWQSLFDPTDLSQAVVAETDLMKVSAYSTMVSHAVKCMNASLYARFFKYAPLQYVFSDVYDILKDTSGFVNVKEAHGPELITGDLANYTVIEDSNIEKLHMVAMLNEFATPHVALR